MLLAEPISEAKVYRAFKHKVVEKSVNLYWTC